MRTNKENREGAMDKTERRTMTFEVRVEERENEPPKIVGHAAVFDQEAEIAGLFREMVAPGAFTKTIKEDDIRALFNHDPNFVLGRNKAGTLKLSEDKQGLRMEVTPPDTQLVRDLVMEPIRRGDISQQSIGFQVRAEEWRDDDSDLELRIIREARLFDVSPVTFPAYEGTDVALRSRDAHKEKRKGKSINIKRKRLKLMEDC